MSEDDPRYSTLSTGADERIYAGRDWLKKVAELEDEIEGGVAAGAVEPDALHDPILVALSNARTYGDRVVLNRDVWVALRAALTPRGQVEPEPQAIVSVGEEEALLCGPERAKWASFWAVRISAGLVESDAQFADQCAAMMRDARNIATALRTSAAAEEK